MTESDSAVVLEEVHKEYLMGETTVRALRGISLVIKRGEFMAILGQSGSGKTTLLNMMAALDVPTSGRVLYQGTDLSTMRPAKRTELRRRAIGLVFQFYNLFPTLTAAENVEIGITLNIRDERALRERAMKYLGMVGLSERADSYPSQLSGGEQQRVAIARGLAKEPVLLLLDEPTGNLDAETSDMIWALVKRINEETGTTVVAVTHQTSVSDIATRSIFLRSGEIYGVHQRE